jgi:hypothetical protein
MLAHGIRLQVTPGDVYKFGGYHTSTAKSRTRVVKKSLKPDFNETLVLLLDGTVDHSKHGRPRLLLTLSDWDEGGEEMIGQLDLDLAEMIATTARCQVWHREEQSLRDYLADMQHGTKFSAMPALMKKAKEESLTKSITYLEHLRRKVLGGMEKMWMDLEWVPGCIPDTRQVLTLLALLVQSTNTGEDVDGS